MEEKKGSKAKQLKGLFSKLLFVNKWQFIRYAKHNEYGEKKFIYFIHQTVKNSLIYSTFVRVNIVYPSEYYCMFANPFYLEENYKEGCESFQLL